jgi:hypothetical protein
MPDRRTHRGPNPQDAELFAPSAWPALRDATGDLGWLLGRGYSETSALKVVGDRYSLAARQRDAVMRAACPDEAAARRRERMILPAAPDAQDLRGRPLLIDGYNVLTTVEAALAGAVVLRCRDDAYRDIASVHGTWRRVQETIPAMTLIGRALARLAVCECRWYLDSPVSNSGRLKTLMRQVARDEGWPWQVELVQSPDRVLIQSDEIVATSDGVILDRCRRWCNLARAVIDACVPGARVVDLSL